MKAERDSTGIALPLILAVRMGVGLFLIRAK